MHCIVSSLSPGQHYYHTCTSGHEIIRIRFGNDLTNPAIWSDILNSTVQSFSKCSDINRKWQMSDHNFGLCVHASVYTSIMSAVGL